MCCLACNKTHAIIPGFSVPNSSHNTIDLEIYYKKRHEQKTRKEAAKGLSLEKYSYQSLRRLDKRIEYRAIALKACEAIGKTENLFGYSFLCSHFLSTSPVAAITRHYMTKHGKGFLFGNISWLCKQDKSRKTFSHKMFNPQQTIKAIDSS